MITFAKIGMLMVSILPTTTLAHYKLIRDYSSYNLVDNFDFYNGPDPTNGHVDYKGYATANATGLTGLLVGPNGTNVQNSTMPPPVYFGVDHTNVYPNTTGRPSVRVSSVQTFNHSLIIADIAHMPSSTCGLWPAFWMLGTGATWPNAGEIDILENVNDADFNIMTLHTNAGLVVANSTDKFTGNLKTANCDVNAQDQDKNVGCSIKDDASKNSYGTNFNSNGGGVFAVDYTSSHIAIWFFPRNAIPANIASGSTTIAPSSNATDSLGFDGWGKPNALFEPTSAATTSATVPVTANTIIPIDSASVSAKYGTNTTTTTTPSVLDAHFTSLQLIFDTTFCGDWAGKVWSAPDSSCAKLAPTCEEYVSANPAAFKDAFWAVQSIKVYKDADTDPDPDTVGGMKEKRGGDVVVRSLKRARERRWRMLPEQEEGL